MQTQTVPAAARSRRPRSLEEVEAWGRALGDMDAFLREFLDEFYVAHHPHVQAQMLSDEPQRGDDLRANAYLAAVAEHLALRNKLPVPGWVSEPARFLKMPYFPCGLESLKATLLVESPPAFRRRMIFVGADPLYRPRRGPIGVA